MSDFVIGDRVEAIDDTVKGTVIEVGANEIVIATADGFQMSYLPSDLLKISNTSQLEVSNYEVAKIKAEKEQTRPKPRPAPKPKERNAPKMEVDLHIHQLTKSTKGMSNHEMLNLQLDTAKRQLDFAMRKRIQKIVFIHGVGDGVLKEELKYLFNRYENLKFYDADYKKYGLGATEVYIYQNT